MTVRDSAAVFVVAASFQLAGSTASWKLAATIQPNSRTVI